MYFKKGEEEMCYGLATIKDEMRMDGIKELEVIEAEIDRGTGMFWCMELQEIGDKADSGCGKMCDSYKPRNGKNGICKHHRNTYSYTDKVMTIKVK